MSDMPPPPPPQPFSPQPANQPGPQQPPPPAPAPSPYTVPGPTTPGAPPPPPGFGGMAGGPPFAGGFPAAPRRSGKAIAALVLGISGLLLCFVAVPAILAIIFGVLAMKEIKRSAGTVSGRGMAIAGLVLGIVGIISAVVFWIAIGFGLANSKNVFDLEVGDCIELPDSDAEEVVRVQTLDCDEPHGAQVFAVGELPGGDEPYPGVDEVQAMIETQCRPAFAEYVGIDFELSELSVTTIYPQAGDWDETQQFVCIAFDPDGDLTGSIAGTGR
jgi:hypothetical protein